MGSGNTDLYASIAFLAVQRLFGSGFEAQRAVLLCAERWHVPPRVCLGSDISAPSVGGM